MSIYRLPPFRPVEILWSNVEGLGVRLEEGDPDRRWALLATEEREG